MTRNWNVTDDTKKKVEAVDELRTHNHLTAKKACEKVGIPRGTYQHAKWAMNGGPNGTTHGPGRPKTATVPVESSIDLAVPKLVDDVRRLVKRIEAELAAHDKLIAARDRLQAMLNAGVVEERMNDVDQNRVAAMLRT